MLDTILLFLLALMAGVGVATGVFAFITVITVVPRIVSYVGIKNIILVENVLVCGIIVGNIATVYMGQMQWPFSTGLFCVLGLCMGIFVGCIAVALAEILHTFPIIFRRLSIRRGLSAMVVAMALGKTVGALYYFFFGYAIL